MVESLSAGRSREEIARAVEGYLSIGGLLDGGLAQQVEFDLDAFRRATGSRLSGREMEILREQQHQAMRWTFLGTGMTHPKFLGSVEAMDPAQRLRLETEVAPLFH
jgi:hypothetical protein